MVKLKYDRKRPKSEKKCSTNAGPRIRATTPFSFTGSNMTPFGGVFAAGALVEKLRLEKLFQDKLTIERRTEIEPSRYLCAMVYMLYIGYDRIGHIQYLRNDPIFKRLLGLSNVPVQSSFWRFLNESLDLRHEDQLRRVIFDMQEQVWQGANIGLRKVHVDTDTTVETVYGNQEQATVGYNPKNRGKKSYQPVLTTIAETGEILCARHRGGTTISGKEIARHLDDVFIHIQHVECVVSRMDSGFYCREAIDKHEEYGINFIIAVKKQAPIQEQIRDVHWRTARHCDGIVEFRYQPKGWSKPYRYIVTRYKKKNDEGQTDMFEDTSYKYRVFVTDLSAKAEKVVAEYDGRATVENIIEEGKNQIAFAKIPGHCFAANANYLQLVTLAFNLNKWLQLFGRDEASEFHWEEIQTSRFRHLYLACRIATSGHKTILRFASEYPYKEYFMRLLDRIRKVVWNPGQIAAVVNRMLVPRTA